MLLDVRYRPADIQQPSGSFLSPTRTKVLAICRVNGLPPHNIAQRLYCQHTTDPRFVQALGSLGSFPIVPGSKSASSASSLLLTTTASRSFLSHRTVEGVFVVHFYRARAPPDSQCRGLSTSPFVASWSFSGRRCRPRCCLLFCSFPFGVEFPSPLLDSLETAFMIAVSP
jgi:hypothetical protein